MWSKQVVTKPPLERFVSRLDELVPLLADDRRALLGLHGPIVQVRARADVVTPGTDVACAYLLLHGLVARFAQLKSGLRQLTVLHIPGDAADLHAIPVSRAITAMEALTTSTLMCIPLVTIRSLAVERPAIAQALWAYAAVDAAILARWSASWARLPARSRMAHLLCELGMRTENAGLNARCDFELDMTQSQLGDALGLTPVHVNRTLQSLRQAQIISTAGRRFLIKDWDALAELGEFDPDYLLLPDSELRAA
jgi:CRP-like cAMP-binding protein